MFRFAWNRYRAAYAGLPRELWVLALVLLVNRSGAMVLVFLTLYLTSEIGMSQAAAGQMISLYGAGAIAGAYLGGRLVEVVGAVRLQTCCLLLAVPGYLALPVWESPLAIGINIFLLSLANEAVRPANATAVAKLANPSDRTRAFALQRLAANLGFSFGPAIGGVLATINYSLLFVVDAGTTLLAALILLAYFGMQRLPGEVPRGSLAAVAGPISDGVYLRFLGLFLLSSVVFFQLISTYPLYLKEHYRLNEDGIGLLFAVNTLMVVLFEMLLIDYAKRWPLVRTIGWGCFLSCVGFGLLPFGSTFAFAVLAMVVLTVGEMLSMPLAVGYVADRAPVGSEGRYMGWWAMSISVAFVLGPALGGMAYGENPDLVWLVSLVVAVVVLVGFYRLPAASPRQTQAADAPPPAGEAVELCPDSLGS